MTLSSRSVVWFAAAFYFLVLSFFSVANYKAPRTQMIDLGHAAQSIWMASKGDLSMPNSDCWEKEPVSRLRMHVNLVYWLLAPLYAVIPDPQLLLYVTTLACMLGGVGLYELARLRWGDTRWALVPAVVYYLSPMVQDANLYDFKPITIAAAAAIWAVWAFEKKRDVLAWILLALILTCQEDQAAIVPMIGLFRVWRGHWKQGLAIVAAGIVYILAIFLVIVPALSPGGFIGIGTRYIYGEPKTIDTLLAILGRAFRPDRLRSVVYCLLSGGIVALRAWPAFLIGFPAMIGAMVSLPSVPCRITGTYYWIPVIASILIASIFAYEHGKQKKAMIYLAVSTAFFSFLFSGLPYGFGVSTANFRTNDFNALKEVIREIPPDAAVCAQNNLGPILSNRRVIASFPIRINEAEYLIVQPKPPVGPSTGVLLQHDYLTVNAWFMKDFNKRLISIASSPEWELVKEKNRIYLFKRRTSPSPPDMAMVERFKTDLWALSWEAAHNMTYRWPANFYLNESYSWKDLFKRLFQKPVS